MILSKILHSLYLKIYISIIVSNSKTSVCVHALKNGTLKESFFETFPSRDVSEELIEYVQSFIDETPFYYISLLDYSISQGAMPSCEGSEFFLYSDLETPQKICHDGWNSFTSKVDIINFEKKYSAFGLDFIFSPYTVIKNFFKDKISGEAALFILVQEDSLIVTVFENSMLKYSEFINMRTEQPDESISMLDDDKEELNFDMEDQHSVNLEEIDIDDGFGDIDDLTDIEDLDTMDDLEDFAEVKVKEPSKEASRHFEPDDRDAAGFNEDYRRFSVIQSSLNQYYTDEKYENKFIESAYIAVACHVDHDLKNYLEEELFLKVYVRQLEICQEILDLAKRENV
ncbi:hypothetical protein [Sulfurimonas sp. HSL-1716]|uniref:hypothetical protein n=1 Tax=Hydrocurvibacter sulfurireducens TaxID=3131937 RepID=UPI0031F9D7CC